MTTHPFQFPCPKPRSQPQFFPFPQHPSNPSVYWIAVGFVVCASKNIFWIHPCCSTLVPATSPSSNGSPSNLEENSKCPAPAHTPCPLLSSHLLTLSPSVTPLFQPSCFPQTTHVILTSGPLPFSFLLLGMIYHMASFYYSGLGSNVTSSDKRSLITQPASYTALLYYPTPLIFCNSPYTAASTTHLCFFVYYLSPSHQKVSCIIAFRFVLLTFIPNSLMPRTVPDT